MKKDLVLHLSPTQTAFVHSDADIAQIIGPMGEGKTYAAAVALYVHAVRCGKNIRGALIRDTHTNIEISTIPDLREMFGSRVTFHNDNRKMIYHSNPKVELDLFGIDDPASLSKLQGPQYAIVWLEEPAPIISRANAGLPVEVLNLAIARASRQRETKMRVQLSQNPSDEDHWSEELANMPRVYIEDRDGVQIIKETFRIPHGENAFLNDKTRLANMAAFRADPGMYDRYVRGVAAPVRKGKAVTPYYNPDIHYSRDELPVVEGGIGIRGWDGWHSSTVVIGQYVPPGRLIIHEVLTGEGAGVEELITGKLIPRMRSPKYAGKIHEWREIGDPSMATPDQSSVSRSAKKVIESHLKTRFEKGMNRWETRRMSLSNALTRNCPDGKPQVLISCTAHPLHKALNGGWHYKTDNSGNIMSEIPEKDPHSHIGDAFTYPVSLLFSPVEEQKTNRMPPRPKRAMSYGGSAGRSAGGMY